MEWHRPLSQGLMDILIRTQAGKQYRLIRQDAPTRHTTNSAYQSADQLKSLLAGAEPLSPSTWPELWQQVRAANGANHSSPSVIQEALHELAEKQLLHLVPFEPRRRTRGANRGAASGSGGGESAP